MEKTSIYVFFFESQNVEIQSVFITQLLVGVGPVGPLYSKLFFFYRYSVIRNLKKFNICTVHMYMYVEYMEHSILGLFFLYTITQNLHFAGTYFRQRGDIGRILGFLL